MEDKCPICDRDDCKRHQLCGCGPDDWCKLQQECSEHAVDWRARALKAEADFVAGTLRWEETAKFAADLEARLDRAWGVVAATMHALRGKEEDEPVDLDDVQGVVGTARMIRYERDRAKKLLAELGIPIEEN